jgi:hypothetical protein
MNIVNPLKRDDVHIINLMPLEELLFGIGDPHGVSGSEQARLPPSPSAYASLRVTKTLIAMSCLSLRTYMLLSCCVAVSLCYYCGLYFMLLCRFDDLNPSFLNRSPSKTIGRGVQQEFYGTSYRGAA